MQTRDSIRHPKYIATILVICIIAITPAAISNEESGATSYGFIYECPVCGYETNDYSNYLLHIEEENEKAERRELIITIAAIAVISAIVSSILIILIPKNKNQIALLEYKIKHLEDKIKELSEKESTKKCNPEHQRVCPNCGYATDTNNKFCMKCGKML